MNESQIKHGGCLCGAVRYNVHGPMRGVVNCHCEMCRRLHGAFGAYTKVSNADLTLVEDKGLAWYRSSAAVFAGTAAPACFGNRPALKPPQSPPARSTNPAVWPPSAISTRRRKAISTTLATA